jgi:hypothetical protein
VQPGGEIVIAERRPNGTIASKTHCSRGHEFTTENTRTKKSDGSQVCRKCVQVRKKKHKKTPWTREQLADVTKKHKQLSMTLYPARPKGESKRLQGKRRKDRAAKLVIDMKAAPCADCGGQFHYTAMEFDHLPGFKKRAAVSALVSKGKPASVILDEIAKCELVCSNCHRVRTFTRKQNLQPGRATLA